MECDKHVVRLTIMHNKAQQLQWSSQNVSESLCGMPLRECKTMLPRKFKRQCATYGSSTRKCASGYSLLAENMTC